MQVDTATTLAQNPPDARPGGGDTLDPSVVAGRPVPARGRAKSTGKAKLLTLQQLDGRTVAAKRTRQIITDLESDAGGADHLSTAERQIIVRAAILAAYLESQETAWLKGEEIELGEYLAASNGLRRLLVTLGLKRTPRDITPTIEEWAARKVAEKSSKKEDRDE